MYITTPRADDSLEDIADWLELRAFFEGEVSFSELYYLIEDNVDTDDDEIASEDTRVDDFNTRIENIILDRIDRLKNTYPFYIYTSMLRFVDLQDKAQISYIYCLLVSHLRKDQLLETEKNRLNNTVRDYMQIIATACAAGDVCGHASAFGYPRPAREKMLIKLRTLYCPERIPSGTIKKTIPIFLQSQKDDGIDVIAWSLHSDGRLNHYLLGQAATGDNWQSKPVPARKFHQDWFTQQPHIKPKLAIFIPVLAGKNVPYDERQDYYKSRESTLGHIFDRESIPSKVTKATKLFVTGHTIERFNEYPAIQAWLNDVQREYNDKSKEYYGRLLVITR